MHDLAWWRGATIYQIYPRSFADSNNDGVGDLPGITARLDHVASLGVDAIWLSPVFLSPQRDFGYDVSDHTAIDPLFGTLHDFDALVERAHALGLRVLIDQVWSHTSTQHAWFRDSRNNGAMADWYVWPMHNRTARRQTTGSPYSAAAPGPGSHGASNSICITSSQTSRSSICTTRRCRMRCWILAGSGLIGA